MVDRPLEFAFALRACVLPGAALPLLISTIRARTVRAPSFSTKFEAGIENLSSEILEGAALLHGAADRAEDVVDADRLRELADAMRAGHPAHVNDINATVLHLMGIDHSKFTFKFQGLDQRLTGVEEQKVIKELLK